MKGATAMLLSSHHLFAAAAATNAAVATAGDTNDLYHPGSSSSSSGSSSASSSSTNANNFEAGGLRWINMPTTTTPSATTTNTGSGERGSGHHQTMVENQCTFCFKSFSNRGSMTRHMRDQHLQPNNTVTCDICGKVCKNRNCLITHRSVAHNAKRRTTRASEVAAAAAANNFPTDSGIFVSNSI